MATAFDVVLRYPDSTIQQVHDMLADPGFREQVCVFQGDLRHVVRIERARERLEVEVERVQSSNGVPSAIFFTHSRVSMNQCVMRSSSTYKCRSKLVFRWSVAASKRWLRS